MFVSNLSIAFNEVVNTFPSHTELKYPDENCEVSYIKLKKIVDCISRHLIINYSGAKYRGVVVILNDKSPIAFASMLACLQLGLTYTNIDPEIPIERFKKILETCKPKLILTASLKLLNDNPNLLKFAVNWLEFDSIDFDCNVEVDCKDVLKVSGATPAYIMFTSGSTGTPKGVVISHANVLWFIAWARERFDITTKDVITNLNPIFFDNSVFDFYSAIFNGACLVPFKSQQVIDSKNLVEMIDRMRCTIWFSVPSLLNYLLTTRVLSRKNFSSLKKIIFGGEGFPKKKLKQLYEMFADRIDLVNVYGPTECTCICSAHTITDSDFVDMQSIATLGYISQNFEYEILSTNPDEKDTGELLLGGPHVGLGYYNDTDRTARSFIQNPFQNDYIDVVYCTGDIVRRDQFGRLHFVGRKDFQIKHMGYRIELEEIESAINSIDNVVESVVIYKNVGDGIGNIYGFVATNHIGCTPNMLIDRLRTILPSYMIPKRIYLMNSLPKNSNGKTDRAALNDFDYGVVQ